MSTGPLEFSAAGLRRHLFEELLPLWLAHGVDPGPGVFHGRLGAGLVPASDPERRLLVQARMLYVLSHASLLGAPQELVSRVEPIFEALVARYHDRRHGGFWLTVDPGGDPLDTRKDAYVHAFVLMALAYASRVGPGADAASLAASTFALCDTRLRDAVHGGWHESASDDWKLVARPRRQNPHMHLLEALLALHEAGGEPVYLERAAEIVALLRNRWLDEETGALHEHFGVDWSRAQEPSVEPGHHFEWTWLLECYADETGDETARALADGLFDFGLRYGVDRERGGVYDELGPDGSPRRDTKRLWPQTECLRALTTGAAERRGSDVELVPFLAQLAARYRADEHAGWHEQADREGRIRSEWMRATSVYHVFTSLIATAKYLERAPAR